MGTHQFTEYLADEVPATSKQTLREEVGEHDRDGLITSDDPVKARYGGDELWDDSLRVTPLPEGYRP